MPRTKTVTTTSTNIGIRPLMGYLLVEPLAAETKTAGGLYLPESAQEKKADQGVVVARGEDMYLPDGKVFSSPVKIGDEVIYKKWGGDDVKYKGKDYKI